MCIRDRSPSHVKLCLMKNIIKRMIRDGEGFKFVRGKFPQLNVAKFEEGISVGPQFRKLLKDQNLKRVPTSNEEVA